MSKLKVQKWLKAVSQQNSYDIVATLDKLKERYGIKYKLYQDSIILNYDLINMPYPDSDIVRECRGLQLSIKDFSVISRAMDRFLNYGEGNTKDIVFDPDTVVFNKIDGSLVILYWSDYTNSWQVRTRGTAFAEAQVSSIHEDIQKILETSSITFKDLILSAMGLENLEPLKWNLARNYSYVFELVSPENRIITPYFERKLYYITTFDNLINVEEDAYEKGYEYISNFVNCCKIPYTKMFSLENTIKNSKELAPTDEGYVVLNSYNERVKIKNPAYVALHLLHNNGCITGKRILELIEIGEDSEYLSYFPSEKYKFDSIVAERDKLFKEILYSYAGIKNIENQKDFAKEATKYKYSGILFKLRQNQYLDVIWKNLSINYKEKLLMGEQNV